MEHPPQRLLLFSRHRSYQLALRPTLRQTMSKTFYVSSKSKGQSFCRTMLKNLMKYMQNRDEPRKRGTYLASTESSWTPEESLEASDLTGCSASSISGVLLPSRDARSGDCQDSAATDCPPVEEKWRSCFFNRSWFLWAIDGNFALDLLLGQPALRVCKIQTVGHPGSNH